VRVTVAALAGLVTGFLISPRLPVETAILVGWDCTAAVFVVLVWSRLLRFDSARTAQHALEEDPVRPVADLLLLGAAAGSLVAVGFVLFQSGQPAGAPRWVVTLLALASVVLSWAVVHTVFALRYAAIYYSQGGGIDFNQESTPRYWDFAYLAFTVGMTFQVSDTAIRDSEIRRAVLKQSMLSYLFGTGILATTINLVAGLSH
jgi:uncharacterized membrane protein